MKFDKYDAVMLAEAAYRRARRTMRDALRNATPMAEADIRRRAKASGLDPNAASASPREFRSFCRAMAKMMPTITADAPTRRPWPRRYAPTIGWV